jgi:hypothetical protein
MGVRGWDGLMDPAGGSRHVSLRKMMYTRLQVVGEPQ